MRLRTPISNSLMIVSASVSTYTIHRDGGNGPQSYELIISYKGDCHRCGVTVEALGKAPILFSYVNNTSGHILPSSEFFIALRKKGICGIIKDACCAAWVDSYGFASNYDFLNRKRHG